MTTPYQARSDDQPWSHSLGKRPYTVQVYERMDKGGVVYLKWRENGKPQYRSLGFTVRDDRGRPRKGKQAEALAEAEAWQAALSGGTPLPRPEGPLTLHTGLQQALWSDEGIHVSDTPERQEARRYAGVLEAALGPAFPITNVAPRTAQTVWRYVLREMATPEAKARAAAANPRTPTGRGTMIRTAEKCVNLLYQVVRHLHERDPKGIPAALPMRKWKRALRQEWRQELGVIHRVAKPRHSPAEVRKLILALPQAEPRLQILLDTGMELRSGQVRRATRSDLDLGPVGAFELGRLTIQGTETKPGETVDIHPEMRERIDYALTEGYLSELETAFQEQKIKDYHLFPGNRLSRGVVTLPSYSRKPRHVPKRSALAWFHALEADAGVEHVEGRSFYGLRRVLVDVARDYTDNDRALDRLTGHIDPTTRIKEYMDRQRDEDRALAAEVRRRYRLDLAGEAGKLTLAERILGSPQLVRFVVGVMGAAIETGQSTLNLEPLMAGLEEVLGTDSEGA